HIAVLLNVDVDHLNWHKDEDDYRRAKLRIFENQTPADYSIINADEAVFAEAAKATRGRVCAYSLTRTQNAVAWTESNFTCLDESLGTADATGIAHKIVDRSALPVIGAVNISNALAVATVARLAGAPFDAIAEGLKTFKPLAHRLEYCGEQAGIKFFDDSKGTTPHASIAAMKALAGGPWLTVILGGSEKNLDYSELAQVASRLCHAVVLTGEAGPRMLRAFETIPACGNGKKNAFLIVEMDFSKAVERAVQVTPTDGTVLLSPACASFDYFKNYAERGDFFKRKVKEFAVPVPA
ncbi:MAG: UDP-N-acetylmuramoyl-L-alanine--D-glutamate ligase, partial [bacterium]